MTLANLLAASAAQTTLAEIDELGADSALSLAANHDPYDGYHWRPNDIWAEDDEGSDDAAPSPASVLPEDRGRDGDGVATSTEWQRPILSRDGDADYVARAGAIERRLAFRLTPERQRVLGHFAALHNARGAVPAANHKFHTRGILLRAGVDFRDFLGQRALREDIEKLGPLFPLEQIMSIASIRGEKVVTAISIARETMDMMERDSILAPRAFKNGKLPSLPAFAQLACLPTEVVASSSAIKKEYSKRVASGRIKLGEHYVDPLAPSRAARKAARKQLIELIRDDVRKGKPVKASSFRGTKIDIDHYLDRAGIESAALRDVMRRDQLFRRDLAEIIRQAGLRPVHIARLDPLQVAYERLSSDEAGGVMRQFYRAANPSAEPNSDAEGAWLRNERSYLNRFAKVNGRAPGDDALVDFRSDEFDTMLGAGRTGSVKGDRQYETSVRERWRDVAERLVRDATLPASYAGALDAAMVAAGATAPHLAEQLGCSKSLIHAWRRGGSLPTFQNVHLIPRLEELLGLPPGTLLGRLPRARNSRTLTGGRKEITLDDGRVVALGGLWRYMHPDAPVWPEDRLRVHVAETVERVHGVDTAHRLRMRAAWRNDYGLPPEDPDSPIWREWPDLVAFKTDLVDDGRHRHERAGWRSRGTIDLHRKQVGIFSRWLMMAPEKGGLGLHPSEVSFSLLLNHRVVLRYVTWRITRAADIELNGQPIGPMVTSTEKQLLAFFADLVDADYGWLAQSHGRVGAPAPIAKTFRLPHLRVVKQPGKVDELTVLDDDTCPVHECMPAALAERCATPDGWRAVAGEACKFLRTVQSHVAKSWKLIRNPQLLVMPILKSPHPVAVGLRMVRDALRHAPNIETSPILHATEVQKALAFLLLLLVVFRSGTMRSLTWRADGTGHVRKVGGSWEIVVGHEHFKNGISTELFGPSWNRRDYERELGDWGGLNEVLDHFVGKCRPLLLGSRQSDLLFPPPRRRSDWSEHNFNYLVMSFTRKWCVWNPRYRTGIRGVKAFGPHPARNIVATHIIRNHKGEDRWRLAALVLGTGETKVRLNYGWVTSREELGRTDGLFQEASDLAASDVPLY